MPGAGGMNLLDLDDPLAVSPDLEEVQLARISTAVGLGPFLNEMHQILEAVVDKHVVHESDGSRGPGSRSTTPIPQIIRSRF